MENHSVDDAQDALLLSEQLRMRLRAVGEERYHHQHPFHLMMHEGQLTRGQLQAWALEPLLLPEPHPHQGCDHSFPQ